MLDEFVLTDEKAIKVLSDPLRQKVLWVLMDHGPQTSSGVARALGLAASKVHYHLGKLESVGLIVLDHEEVIHGIQARYMRPVARTFKMNTDSIRLNPATQNAVLRVARGELDQVYRLLEHELAQPEATDAVLLLSRLRLTASESRSLDAELQDLLARWEAVSKGRPASGSEATGTDQLRTWKLLLAAVPEGGR